MVPRCNRLTVLGALVTQSVNHWPASELILNPTGSGFLFNPIALIMAKTLWSFGHSECNRVNKKQDSVTDKLLLFR